MRPPSAWHCEATSVTILDRMATSAQKSAVVLAFVAAGLSFASAVVRFARDGEIRLTLFAGGVFMLALAIGGLMRLRGPKP